MPEPQTAEPPEIPDAPTPAPETYFDRLLRLQEADLMGRIECAYLHTIEPPL